MPHLPVNPTYLPNSHQWFVCFRCCISHVPAWFGFNPWLCVCLCLRLCLRLCVFVLCVLSLLLLHRFAHVCGSVWVFVCPVLSFSAVRSVWPVCPVCFVSPVCFVCPLSLSLFCLFCSVWSVCPVCLFCSVCSVCPFYLSVWVCFRVFVVALLLLLCVCVGCFFAVLFVVFRSCCRNSLPLSRGKPGCSIIAPILPSGISF